MRILWLTDIHLNFIGQNRIDAFCREIDSAKPEAILIGGDIGEAANVGGYLQRLEACLPVPIYFVLGNHDYYGGSLAAVRDEIAALVRQSSRLFWLPSYPGKEAGNKKPASSGNTPEKAGLRPCMHCYRGTDGLRLSSCR